MNTRYLYASHIDGHLYDVERKLSREELLCNDCYEEDYLVGEYCTEEKRESMAHKHYRELLSDAIPLAPLRRGESILLVSRGKKFYAVPKQYAVC